MACKRSFREDGRKRAENGGERSGHWWNWARDQRQREEGAGEDVDLLIACKPKGQDEMWGHQRDRQDEVHVHLNLERLQWDNELWNSDAEVGRGSQEGSRSKFIGVILTLQRDSNGIKTAVCFSFLWMKLRIIFQTQRDVYNSQVNTDHREQEAAVTPVPSLTSWRCLSTSWFKMHCFTH